MKHLGPASIVLFAMLLFPACKAPASSSLESVVVVARLDEDRNRFELAVGLADEVAHSLSRSPDILVRAGAAHSLAKASFAEVKERMAADIVVWVNVERAGDKLVVQYEMETSTGELRAPTTLAASVDQLFSVPRRIATDALSSMKQPPLDAAQYPDWPAPSSSSEYTGFLRALAQSPAKKEAERVAMFDALSSSLESYPRPFSNWDVLTLTWPVSRPALLSTTTTPSKRCDARFNSTRATLGRELSWLHTLPSAAGPKNPSNCCRMGSSIIRSFQDFTISSAMFCGMRV